MRDAECGDDSIRTCRICRYKEVRITEISTESFCFRVREQVERPRHIRIGFYDLSESMYRSGVRKLSFYGKRQEQWYVNCRQGNQQDYAQQYRNFSGNTIGYIRATGFMERTERAQIVCNYPADQDDPCGEHGRAELGLVFRHGIQLRYRAWNLLWNLTEHMV